MILLTAFPRVVSSSLGKAMLKALNNYKIKQDFPGSRGLIGILLRHLGLEGSREIAVRMRTSVFKEHIWPAFIITS